MEHKIRFVMGGEIREVAEVDPTLTVLRYLREEVRRTATKEGCAEGDCGACTVAIGELDGNRIRYRSVNACIQFLTALDGKLLVTAEDLKSPSGDLHPAQEAMLTCHGSQCGFCTPGFVMSLFVLNRETPSPSHQEINDALAGNLCRCTGYGPIKAAAVSMSNAPGRDPLADNEQHLVTLLEKIQRDEMLTVAQDGRRIHSPATVEELTEALAQDPDATILAGGTDVGLWVTKHHRKLPTVVYIGNVGALKNIDDRGDEVEIGAAVTYSEAFETLAALHPDVGELMRRLASRQIRNLGTLVGNIANGSPIGDSPPALIALGATLRLRSAAGQREIPLEDFFLDYGVQDRQPGEFVEAVRIHKPREDSHYRVYKLSKRFDQDISAVCGAFHVRLNDGVVTETRICFGGMAATPKRAEACESYLAGKPWSRETIEKACEALGADYAPIDDMRASADYRSATAANLLMKFYLETDRSASETRVLEAAGLLPDVKRPYSPEEDEEDAIKGGVMTHLEHDSGVHHVCGDAIYIDDMREPAGTLFLHPVLSTRPCATIAALRLTAAERCPGVVGILTEDDIPGSNDFGHAGLDDDRVISSRRVDYAGQIVCVIMAENMDAAREAAKLIEIEYQDEEPILTIEDAVKRNSYLGEPQRVSIGDHSYNLDQGPHRLSGRLATGAQDHFYLEGQISLATPKEDSDVHLHCSTQDPTAVQQLVARVLGRPANAVTVEVRRMGGAFGGKETQATQFAAIAAIAAVKTGRPAKMRLDRDDDMKTTGKRHEFESEYDVSYDDEGRIQALKVETFMRAGVSEDQTPYILFRALNHFDNCYYLEHADFTGHMCRTNTVSACAFRGFGSPQAFAVSERVIDRIAFELDKDPLDVRLTNAYGVGERHETPFGGLVHDNELPRLLSEIEKSSGYRQRRADVRDFNRKNQWLKKGIALVPIKYGVGFGASFFEQAGALLHVYTDGSIHLNHGGTEMGQGLFIKCAQVAAHELQVDHHKIKLSSTATDKVPNTTATAASSGTDFNGMAVKVAAQKIRRRLVAFAAEHYNVDEDQIEFRPNRIRVGNQEVPWETLVKEAYMARIPLSATGYYKTPPLIVNTDDRGDRHRYHAYGASCSEVLIDTLTGEHRVLRVDILHDVGRSINPAIDYGQLEGGFIQGMGWLTFEDVHWDEQGILRTHAPSTYKIPVASDHPVDMRMKLVDWSENSTESLHGSKAIGEPPFTLAVSVFCALTDAVAAVGDYKVFPGLNAPATPEQILRAVRDVQARSQQQAQAL